MNPDFRELLLAFTAEKVEYLIVGAYALSAHGYSRFTGDLDILIRRSSENAEKVWAALHRFQAPLSDVTKTDFMSPDVVFQMGRPPARIDILTDISGVTFDEAWQSRVEFSLEGVPIYVIGLEALAKNKQASNRPKDLADLAWIAKRLGNNPSQ